MLSIQEVLEKHGQKDSENENDKKQNDGDKEDKPKENIAQLNDKDDYGLSIGNLRENELTLDSELKWVKKQIIGICKWGGELST